MKFHAFVMFLCTVMLAQFRALTTPNNAVHYGDGGTGSERDANALLLFRSNIKYDPQGVMTSWNTSNHLCEWEGVVCGRRHKRVTVLDLESRGLVGALSPYIGNLSFLRELILSNNMFEGKLPQEIGRLFRLEILSLVNNSLEGEIPANLFRCSNLVALQLADNMFVGEIPKKLGSLSKLQLLSIERNNFTGRIPHSIGNLTSLETISASYNKFGGNIPDIFQRLTNLKEIGLGENELIDGIIPPSLYNLSQLTLLSLSKTRLHGNLPASFGLLFPKLQYLQLRDCRFTGPIPSSLSNATELGFVEMNNNNFSGKVSIDLRVMQSLYKFSIYSNTLGTGRLDDLDFFVSLLNCSQLETVDISFNNFGGALPDSIGNISTSIRNLLIGYNKIYGHIPSWIGTLTNLKLLGMSKNMFTGSIPRSFGQLQKLDRIYLNKNRLSGQIPASLGNLTAISVLVLYENRLNDTIPPSLEKCRNLVYIIMRQNRLSGKIPNEIFDISTLIEVDLSQNHFNGSFTLNVGGLKHLVSLYLYENELFGSIPSSLGGCGSLQYLNMRNNFFHGSIPQSLSSLKGLEAIDLSHNNLSGEIPKYLGTFDLAYLDLSFIDFEGEIPTKGIFTNASAVSLQGNKRLCGGVSELKFPICYTKEPKRRTRSSLTIVIITIFCFVFGVILLSLFTYFRIKRKRKAKAAESDKTLLQVSYRMLYNATDGFSAANLLGSGSFGSVFKGILDVDEKIVAIKVLNLQRRGSLKSFMAECEALRNIRHRNLVKIITSCSSLDYQGNDFKALVYEFMPEGNLDMWLHPIPESSTSRNLNLLQRINIAIDVASAIDYLHHHCHLPIVHCDLKPSNILLDDDMIAHVGDFGIAKFLQELSTPNHTSSTGVRGTVGYAPPEYGIGSAVSTSGDVYSFGIVMLEMITGKRPTDGTFEGGLNLHNFARSAMHGHIMKILDPVLLCSEAEVETNTNIRSVAQARNEDARDECLISILNIGIA